MEFLILGPLQARVGGDPIALGGPRQRALLARLLLSRNRVVSSRRLLDDLWPDEPPASGLTALQVRISQLRRVLGEGARLLTRAPGYVLALEPGRLDAELFEALL